MDEQISYFMHELDETRALGGAASSHIPTLGAATTAVDQYRTYSINANNLPALGAAFTDIASVTALARVAEGGIRSHRDLEAAEIALQAILLHDIVHVIVHAPKVDFGSGLISYQRWDNNARTDAAFELMGLARSRDFLIAPEMVKVQDGLIVSATFADSPLLGRKIDSLTPGYDYWNVNVGDAVNAAISQHGIPVYISDPLLMKTRRGDGFAKGFYHRLKVSWQKATEGIPEVVCSFSLPPMLAIVLDRLDNRQDLKAVLRDLREELAPVRQELREFNDIVTAPISQQEVARRVKYINESFDAIMLEASLSSAERIQRRLAGVQRLTRPLIKLMAGFVTKTGLTSDDLLGWSGPATIFESQSVVDRTITAKTFKGLVRTEAVQSLIKMHLTDAEISAIELSLSQTDR